MRGKGNVTEAQSAETRLPEDEPARRQTQGRHRRSARMAVVLAAAAIGLVACSGGSHSPRVASLPASTGAGTSSGTDTRSGGSPASTEPHANPTKLLDEWAACMRAHGDPGQADPTIDANKVIHLTWNDAIPGGIYGTNKGGQGDAGPGQYCRTYIDQAEIDLQGSEHLQQPSQAQLLKFSQCMRANGVADFPDPSSNGGLSFNRAAGGDLNPSNPVFQNASKLCAQQTGVPGFATGGAPQPGSVEFNGDGQGGPGG
jgi:hypothetical protein